MVQKKVTHLFMRRKKQLNGIVGNLEILGLGGHLGISDQFVRKNLSELWVWLEHLFLQSFNQDWSIKPMARLILKRKGQKLLAPCSCYLVEGHLDTRLTSLLKIWSPTIQEYFIQWKRPIKCRSQVCSFFLHKATSTDAGESCQWCTMSAVESVLGCGRQIYCCRYT